MTLNVNECFTKLAVDATALSEWALVEYVKRWHTRVDGATINPLFSNWHGYKTDNMVNLPLDKCFELCPELVQINNIAEISYVAVMKHPPKKVVRLHIDMQEGVGINMMVVYEHGGSMCAFVNRETNKTEKLDYQPNTMYLFNTQVYHTIYNFAGNRYTLTVRFKLNKQLLSYRHMKKIIRKINLL